MQDGYDQTLSGLLRKRAELAREVETHRSQWEAASASLEAIDRAILVFNPSLLPGDLPIRTRPPIAADGTTELQRFLLDLLRRSGEPVRTLAAAAAMGAERGIDPRDRVATTLLRKRVADAFYRLRKRGIVTGAKYGSGAELEWRINQHPQN
ncbi:hypothetical protein ABIB28_001626 [Sphingomonas sp. UYEF23]